MNQLLADLLKLLELERIEINLFRGESRDIGSPQVFGGQVLGQALMAATATVEANRAVHSLHSYFLRAGDFNKPIVYEVDRSRDGASFSSRRVVAIQDGQQIFHMSASFQEPEPSFDHQVAMPSVTAPESLIDVREWVEHAAINLPSVVRQMMLRSRPFEFRPVSPERMFGRGGGSQGNTMGIEPVCHWFRAVGSVPNEEALHRCLLAYVSDYYFVTSSIGLHRINTEKVNLRIATIDHAMWFHRPVRVDDWLLYAVDSPSASSSRGLVRGEIFNRQGQLVASAVQEGLLRVQK